MILKPQCRELRYLISSPLFLSQYTAENKQLQGEKIPFGWKMMVGLGRVVPICVPCAPGPAAVLQVLLNHCDCIAAISWIIKPRSAESGSGEGELENSVMDHFSTWICGYRLMQKKKIKRFTACWERDCNLIYRMMSRLRECCVFWSQNVFPPALLYGKEAWAYENSCYN